eukprot:CAMPEP_0118712218 /NCGR_PEP_ID=MMETSP0800-20121206/24646_1 /TAXON_ID=210618 ORGANISM="Striatella unipunctata, Strain CCMP2910" /NCGR_SAMPLE_ID=MMETSP0800 /ASSEMBLY_ACC=CAM_ASM_000638 /LENGTH=214 /DNA_ID=CAMNT_0006617149 /DNA_START=126 /DNA_END=768 /DNA_ORIENTATION=-
MSFHSVKPLLPLGTYPDPLIPTPIRCESPAQNVFFVARHGQNQHLHVAKGLLLVLQNIALRIHVDDDDDNNNNNNNGNSSGVTCVRVWLDKSENHRGGHGMLLATLRPNVYEQHTPSLSILSNKTKKHTEDDDEEEEEEDNPRIRIQVVMASKQTNNNNHYDNLERRMLACEVHFIGHVQALARDDDEEEEEEHDHDHDEDEEMENAHDHDHWG